MTCKYLIGNYIRAQGTIVASEKLTVIPDRWLAVGRITKDIQSASCLN